MGGWISLKMANENPDVIIGLCVSNGMPFLLHVMLALPREACASLPVTLNDLKSRSIKCVSVPPEKILKPFLVNLKFTFGDHIPLLLRVLVEEISSKSKDIGDSLKGANEASVSADISLLALTVLTALINSLLFISLHFFLSQLSHYL